MKRKLKNTSLKENVSDYLISASVVLPIGIYLFYYFMKRKKEQVKKEMEKCKTTACKEYLERELVSSATKYSALFSISSAISYRILAGIIDEIREELNKNKLRRT